MNNIYKYNTKTQDKTLIASNHSKDILVNDYKTGETSNLDDMLKDVNIKIDNIGTDVNELFDRINTEVGFYDLLNKDGISNTIAANSIKNSSEILELQGYINPIKNDLLIDLKLEDDSLLKTTRANNNENIIDLERLLIKDIGNNDIKLEPLKVPNTRYVTVGDYVYGGIVDKDAKLTVIKFKPGYSNYIEVSRCELEKEGNIYTAYDEFELANINNTLVFFGIKRINKETSEITNKNVLCCLIYNIEENE